MGLTIHYTLRAPSADARQARRLIERLREKALDLGVRGVGPIYDLAGRACRPKELAPGQEPLG